MDDKISKTDARAGEKSGHMRYVLYISLTLAVVAMGAVMFGFI